MKKYIILVIIIICLIAGFFAYVVWNTPKNSNVENPDSQKTEVKNTEIIEIPIESVAGITPDEAEKMCYSIMGERDEETGNTFSFGVSGAIEWNGKQFYTVRASWLVNNSHMSYIGDFFVSSDGEEIYEGIVSSGEYEIGNLISTTLHEN